MTYNQLWLKCLVGVWMVVEVGCDHVVEGVCERRVREMGDLWVAEEAEA